MADHRTQRHQDQENSGVTYGIHGFGLRMTAPDGPGVDVDLVTDPATGRPVEVFDAWRVRWFLDEAAEDGYTGAEIDAALAHLTGDAALIEVVAGRWFALPTDDMARRGRPQRRGQAGIH
ncbi:hypothetical protein O7600_15205 [Micromonospora sp. WMMA1998]|uniref:DUF6896 domain-containing protein n=1 Tax=Micromonospora sp. WMMA1998 TaxID=3015167 RepID=UPI00248B8A59|nr:hypothetical protein [Micromonospora sp. WMMA1998]WBC12537.1 hypothetical protein O7600_15205 [Micromonospora sp. WMMA1998]